VVGVDGRAPRGTAPCPRPWATTFRRISQCATLVLLLSTAEVASYKGSGDAIVTNADRSAGADVTTGSPSCRGLFKQAFSHVRW